MERQRKRYRYRLLILAAVLALTHATAAARLSRPLIAVDETTAGQSEHSGHALVRLTCVIRDATSGDTLAARCSVTDCNGNPRYPPLAESFYHIPWLGYFYADGVFSLDLPPGCTTVRASHGPEYETVVRSVALSGDTTVIVALNRVIDMTLYGWFGGDTHVHINHADGYYTMEPADAHMMARAEGLNLVMCLDNDFGFTGAPDPCSTQRCIVYMSEERRTVAYGDLALHGITDLVTPFSTDWWPLAGEAADSAHAQAGACVVSAHPITTDDFQDIYDWPGTGLARGLPVDMTRDRIDCMEVMSYSNCHDGGIELEVWYRFLNCGFMLPACAGTDACMNRIESYPLGQFRTYAYIGDDSLTYDRWMRAVSAGRTSVTNGPLITKFTASGRTMGETVHLGHGCKEMPCDLSITCASQLDRVEIVVNGSVLRTFPLGGTRCGVDTSFNLPVDRSVWLAARVYGANPHWLPVRDSLFAHTGPIYVSVEGERVVDPHDASFFIDWISDLEDLAREEGYWPGMIDSVRAFDEFAAAKRFYGMLADVSTAVGGYGDLPEPVLFLGRIRPNPFTGGTTIRFGITSAVGDGHRFPAVRGESAELSIYDVRGRLIRRLLNRAITPGPLSVYWDGTDEWGRRVSSGVYFCRFRTGGMSRSTKMVLVR